MNNLEKQNIEEMQVLEVFLSVNPIEGQIIKKTINQKPDVLIKTENNIIGIEITEIKNKEPKIEGRHRDIAKSIEAKLCLNFDGVVDINIIFPTIEISKKEKDMVENNIIALIEYTLNEDKEDKNYYHLELNRGHSNIISIFIFRYTQSKSNNCCARVHVHCVEAGWQNKIPQALVQSIIDIKNSKYSDYIKICNECWLLIYANPINKESHFDFKTIKVNRYNSLFKRTFVMDLFKPKELVEIY